MNAAMLGSFARWAAATGGTYLATKGFGTEDYWSTVVGTVAPLVALTWSQFVHAKA